VKVTQDFRKEILLNNNKRLKLPREVALNILYNTECKGEYANMSLKRHLRQTSFQERDIHFITKLVYGTLEKQITIDMVLENFADLHKINPWVRNIIRMGCYQILFLEKVPDSAVCDESVKLCKTMGYPGLSGFVNAVLRNISRSKNKFKFELVCDTDPIALSMHFSYPVWLVKKWLEDFGTEYTIKIISSMSLDDCTSIRVNTQKITPERLKEILEKSGITVSTGLYVKEALKILKAGDIELNSFYKEGLFTIQDEASMLVVNILDPHPGEYVLDACAAPGGKTIYMSELMANRGQILAWDIHEHRVEMITRNAIRMGSSIICAAKQDARKIAPEKVGQFDRVLVDALCSGLGVCHKKPDIKLKIRLEDMISILDVQWDILSTCSNYVKLGGVLVYSTCTINADENQRMISKFISNYDNFEIDSIHEYLPEALRTVVSDDGTLQLIPSRDFVDGFYITRLKRMV